MNRLQRPRTFLFVAWPQAGHLNPLLAIAEALRERGHACVFAGCGMVADTARAAGFAAHPLADGWAAIGLRVIPRVRGAVETLVACATFCSEPETYARHLLPIVERTGPDVVVSDFAFFGGGLAAQVAGIPWVSVYHAGLAYPGPLVPPFGSGLAVGAAGGWRMQVMRRIETLVRRLVDGRLRRARRTFGLRQHPPPEAPWSSPWLTLVLTSAEAEVPRDPLPSHSFAIGPCLGQRRDPAFPLHLLRRPCAYVTMGTVFDRDPGLLRRILAGLGGSGLQAVVAAGASYNRVRALHRSSDVLVFDRVPQLDVLPHVDVVIHHGGNNTVNESLACGKPQLVLPHGGEQDANASRIVWLGAGLRGDARSDGPARLGEKVRRLIDDDGFRTAASRVADALRRTDGPRTAVQLIERLAQTRAPIERPAGYPATLERATPMPWAWTST